LIDQKLYNNNKQQQLSHLFQVFGVGYMNQNRIMSGQAYGSAFSTHSIKQYAFTKTFSIYILSYYFYSYFLWFPLRSFNLP